MESRFKNGRDMHGDGHYLLEVQNKRTHTHSEMDDPRDSDVTMHRVRGALHIYQVQCFCQVLLDFVVEPSGREKVCLRNLVLFVSPCFISTTSVLATVATRRTQQMHSRVGRHRTRSLLERKAKAQQRKRVRRVGTHAPSGLVSQTNVVAMTNPVVFCRTSSFTHEHFHGFAAAAVCCELNI